MITNLGGCVQTNGETVEDYCTRGENMFIRIKKMGYNDVNNFIWHTHNEVSFVVLTVNMNVSNTFKIN